MNKYIRSDGETTQKVDKELAGYVLTDEKGKTYYYVLDWNNNYNDRTNSLNPYSTNKINNRSMFDDKYISAEIHTHNMAKIGPTNYDGPSFSDSETAKLLGVPVYTIGSTSISVVTPGEKRFTKYGYDNLANGVYTKTDLTIEGRKSINPFYIDSSLSWLENPYLLNSVFPK